jgi:hypothetical protein
MGQSDAAWALLGTTIRLAQTMGLHTERSTVHWPDHVRTKAKNLWYEDRTTIDISSRITADFPQVNNYLAG